MPNPPKYEFIDRYDPETDSVYSLVKITSGPFRDLVVRYHRVQLVEDVENDRLRLVFDYDIIEDNGDGIAENPKQVLGDILYDLLMNEEHRIGKPRDNDPENPAQ